MLSIRLAPPLLAVFIGFTFTDCVFGEEATEPAVSEPRTAIDEEGRIVDFERDIAPIFREHCLECHGPDDAKNDFRIDDAELVIDYLEPEDHQSSSLFTDYMATDDDDMLMPPRSHGGPLRPAELALVRLWINEGAVWPEDARIDSSETPRAPTTEAVTRPTGLIARVWAFQGFLHPATVHFPIALLLLGALFVVLGWKWPALGTQVPMACLLLGAASAIGATMMGWSFSTEKGYGSWAKVDFDAEIFWHRWSAVIVTIVSSGLAVVALLSWKGDRPKMTRTWKVGLLVVAAMVGAVGHQGGELTYGKDFYPKAFRILLGTQDNETSPSEAQAESPTPSPKDVASS